MNTRRLISCLASVSLLLLAGCHRHAPARTTAVAPPLQPASGPVVMVSVPPPTHHSSDFPGEVPTTSNIPVVKPVKPPKKSPRRSQPAVPATATAPAAAAPQSAAATPAPTAAQTIGQLTASTNDPAATRAGAAQAWRREHDRFVAVPAAMQSSHQAEFDQARRFLKSASDALEASDFVGALALTTKARVLLDDLSR